MNNNRLVMILAAAVVVLFIAFVAVVLLSNGNTATPTASNPGTGSSTTPTATSNPGVGSSTGTTFDPTKATKVPADQTPDEFVSAYYQAIIDKKWDAAFKMQPAASQTGSVADFQATQEMYGMKSFKIASKDIGDKEATVIVEQDLGQNGIWNASWTFTKEGGNWLVQARKVGMGAVK